MSQLAGDMGAKLYDARAVTGAPISEATQFVMDSLAANPSARVYIFGYSAGGHAAIQLAQSLDRLGVPVAGLVTFDPHPPTKLYGVRNYDLPRNVGFAINFYQQNPVTTRWGVPYGSNPFLGGAVTCVSCATDPNIRFTNPSVVHTNLARHSIGRYRSEISSALGK